MMNITKREKDVLLFINSYIEDFNYSPCIRDISDGLYLNSTFSVQRHLEHLKQKGFLASGKVPRSFYITAEGYNIINDNK